MTAVRSGGKLADLAKDSRVSLREFLLENLNQHKNLTSLAPELGVTPQRVRIDMSRANVVEIIFLILLILRYNSNSSRNAPFLRGDQLYCSVPLGV